VCAAFRRTGDQHGLGDRASLYVRPSGGHEVIFRNVKWSRV
jgi:hypothetical protein